MSDEAQKTVDSIAAMLGWANTPPRRVLEFEIRAMKSRLAEMRAALEAAAQFLDPEVPRGPAVNGWQNTKMLVEAALPASENK